jgi:hypothetical protein
VKFKLKMTRQRWVVVVVAALLIVGVLVARHNGPSAGRPGRMDTAAAQACTDFANGYPHARSKAARLALADKVTQSSSKSDNKTIADRAAEMGHSAGETDARWKSSATALTSACESAGWKS